MNEAATFGFSDLCQHLELNFANPREYRERYLIELLKGRRDGQ